MTAPLKAYDIEPLTRPAERTSAENHGWCFGLPPGISCEQWPLDPGTGYPLMHGFTLLLPEDYRVHGPDIVALSFFGIAPERNEGGADLIPQLAAAIEARGPAPSDPDLMPFWKVGMVRHPRLSRMKDILDYSYAVILLTQAEFDGPFCQPPRPVPSKYLQGEPPKWLETGSAAAFLDGLYSPQFGPPLEEHWFVRKLGQIPERTPGFNRGLKWTPRSQDPNAGIAPREEWAIEKTGYQPRFYWQDGDAKAENYRIHAWAKDHGSNHIGGTMKPIQNIPEFSPYYVEFEEYFGGFNFAGGNAQLDFRDMAFDWACD